MQKKEEMDVPMAMCRILTPPLLGPEKQESNRIFFFFLKDDDHDDDDIDNDDGGDLTKRH